MPLSSPDIGQAEIQAVVDVLKTPHLSLGPKLVEFESAFARYVGTKYARAVNSGTSGLHLCIKALGIKEGDEVITSPFSFISSANCILFERAKPVFVDIRTDTFNIDESKIEEKITEKTKAILPVHVFGYPCAMEKIKQIADKHNLFVIEDACEAIGAEVDGMKVGTFGDCSVFAFYPNKQMTTGEGGMIVTNNEEIANLAASLRNQGRDDGMEWLAHARLGYNYRLSDINCALGMAQLGRIDEFLAKRESFARAYALRLAEIDGIVLPPQGSNNINRSWFVYVVRLNNDFSKTDRDEIIRRLRREGIGCNRYFPPIHLQPFYVEKFGYKKGSFPVTEEVSGRTIALPFYNNLNEKQIDCVADELKSIIREVKK
ncbi:MAG: DegT/DnrJ/EryC1/StrS family aminotransferase [Candidatus Saganbacteria bacterium]|nr:DegT/DnrJ/EryC1/StrS family aminotransferase [Candidatus Saganbacteria bacterium]